MPHNPIKSMKIDFHDADGVTPTPQDLPQGTPNQGEGSLQRQPAPQSQLDPLKEVLFKSWAMAQGIQDPDAPDNHADLRGMYNKTNGQIHPPGTLTGLQNNVNRVMSAPPTQPMMTPPAGLQVPMGAAGLQAPPSLQGPMASPQMPSGGLLPQGPDGSSEPIQQLLAMLKGGAQG